MKKVTKVTNLVTSLTRLRFVETTFGVSQCYFFALRAVTSYKISMSRYVIVSFANLLIFMLVY